MTPTIAAHAFRMHVRPPGYTFSFQMMKDSQRSEAPQQGVDTDPAIEISSPKRKHSRPEDASSDAVKQGDQVCNDISSRAEVRLALHQHINTRRLTEHSVIHPVCLHSPWEYVAVFQTGTHHQRLLCILFRTHTVTQGAEVETRVKFGIWWEPSHPIGGYVLHGLAKKLVRDLRFQCEETVTLPRPRLPVHLDLFSSDPDDEQTDQIPPYIFDPESVGAMLMSVFESEALQATPWPERTEIKPIFRPIGIEEDSSDLQVCYRQAFPVFHGMINRGTNRLASLRQALRYVFVSAFGIFVRTAQTPRLYFLYIDHELVLLGSAAIMILAGHQLSFEARREWATLPVINPSVLAPLAAQLTALLRGAVKTLFADAPLIRQVEDSLREAATILTSQIGEDGRPTEIQACDTGILPDSLLLPDFPRDGGKWERMPAGRPVDGPTAARNLYHRVGPTSSSTAAAAAPAAGAAPSPPPLEYIKLIPTYTWSYQKSLPGVTRLQQWAVFDLLYSLVGYPDYGKTLHDAPPSAELILPTAHRILVLVIELATDYLCHNDLRLPNVAWQPGRPETVQIIDFDRAAPLGTWHPFDRPTVEVPAPRGTAKLVLLQTSLLLRRLGAGRQKALPNDPHPNPEIETTCTNLTRAADMGIFSELAEWLGKERDRLAAMIRPGGPQPAPDAASATTR
ncbi:hypothetical protein PAPYR_10053 [Paratrimastix pyriformis]|uniref:Protein kinase domain-containing protein n=1 Tax=Paratrimastix pyriformis TaxID=342808 RepID=A0ABQ8UCG8_9EUKA|nr:hypothetical protein PAPYR_10053 [Paratrimastix pyriformis]